MKDILVVIDKKYLLHKELQNQIKTKFDFGDVELSNNIHESIIKIGENHSNYKTIIIIDDYAVAPFLYLSKIENMVVASIYDEHSSFMTAFHNNANVLCLAYEISGFELLISLIESFIRSTFEGGRHYARLDMLNLELKEAE